MNADLKNKTPGLNNPETPVLTHNRFNTYMVLVFTDLKKAQIYKMPYRKSHHQEIEIVTKFDYQHLFRPFGLMEKHMLEEKLTKTSYSKLKIKNIFMWEKKYLLLKQLMILKKVFQKLNIML